MSKGKFLAAVAVAAVVVPAMALASHGKAGLWEITTTINMPNMPQMSPAQMAQMRAMGVRMPAGNSMTVQHCMTAEEVAHDQPPPMRSRDCSIANVKMGGHSLSGDMVCRGHFQGQSHFSVTYNGNEHYSGTSSVTGSADGHPVNSSSSFEGKWLSADCGSVK